jgi:D-cysteine desulfhydrase family pyridoxal phosphate-dependent enzyme
MKELQNKLNGFPQYHFSILPSPIQKLHQLSARYKANIFCMRDDLTGFAFGGNKTRKLDFLIADARSKGFDTLIGVGANQSNFCRLTAAAGKVAGMDVHLLLSGQKPEKPTANLFLDHVFGANVYHTMSTGNAEIEMESVQIEKELAGKGKKVYRMPMGGSTPVGALGYLKAFAEIMDFMQNTNTHFDKIYLASGSGGTQAGLLLGQMLFGWKGSLVGISVGRSETELKQVIGSILEGTSLLLGEQLQPIEIVADEKYIGEGYGKPTLACEMAIKEFAFFEGILLDKVYTGKAAAGMLDYLQNNETENENILFIHTGGNIELFE